MAGLFDGAMMDPRMAGLLSGAFAGLNASGPSATPVSLGQVIGRAGAAGMGAYQDAAAQQLAQRRAEQAMKMQEQQMGLMGVQTQIAQQNAARQAEALAQAQKQREALQGILGRIGQPVSMAPTNENAANPQMYTENDALAAMRRAGLLQEAEQLVKAMPKLDTVNLGGQTKVVDLRATPAGTTFQETMKPGEAARLNWDQYQFGNLSRNQREQLGREDARIGLQRADTYFNTGMTGLGGGGAIGGAAVGAPAVGASGGAPAARTAPQPMTPRMTPKQAQALTAEAPAARAAMASSTSGLDRLAAAAAQIKDDPALKNITGMMGKFPNLPGSAAANVEANLQTLSSQVAFNVLQAMRDASKTGGALGAVSEKEMALLENNLAALAKSQSAEAFRTNLQKIIDFTTESKQRLQSAYADQFSALAPAEPGDGGSAPRPRRYNPATGRLE
jgi:hypothetical protein